MAKDKDKEVSRVYDDLSDLRKGKLPLGGTPTASTVGDGWGYGVFGDKPEQPSNAGWDRNLSFGLSLTSQFAKDLIARAEANFDNGDVSTPL